MRVIGQEEAVTLARIAAKQRRHLLLVGPPGCGKSMIAQALSLHLSAPKEEIRIVHNPENPERPTVEVKREDEVRKELESLGSAEGELDRPDQRADQRLRTPRLPVQELRHLFIAQGPHLPQMRQAQGRRPAQPGQPVRGPDDRTVRADQCCPGSERPGRQGEGDHHQEALRQGGGGRLRALRRDDPGAGPGGAGEAAGTGKGLSPQGAGAA